MVLDFQHWYWDLVKFCQNCSCTEIVSSFLSKLMNCRFFAPDIYTLCETGNLEELKNLVNFHQADVNALSKEKYGKRYSPLTAAVAYNKMPNLDVIKYLIEQGADVNYAVGKSSHGKPYDQALTLLLLNNYFETDLDSVRCLVEGGADKYDTRDISNHGPIHLAIENKRYDILEYLVHQEFSIDSMYKEGSEQGFTPLHYAIIKQKPELVDLLCSLGADMLVTKVDPDKYSEFMKYKGMNATELASACTSHDIINILREYSSGARAKKDIPANSSSQVELDL